MNNKDEFSKENNERIVNKFTSEDSMDKLADFFSIFGDSTRMRIISLLRYHEMNVSQIADELDISLSAVSHQLKTLRAHDLVRVKKDGKYSIYYLSDEHVETIMDLGLTHLREKYE